MGQFLNSLLGREEQATPTPAQQAPKPADAKPADTEPKPEPKSEPKPDTEPKPEQQQVIDVETLKIPANKAKPLHQSTLDLLEDLASIPDGRKKVLEIAEQAEREGKEFARVFVSAEDIEGKYTIDEMAAFDEWGGKYVSVFRLVRPEKDGKPQTLGRAATKKEHRALLELEAKKASKKKSS